MSPLSDLWVLSLPGGICGAFKVVPVKPLFSEITGFVFLFFFPGLNLSLRPFLLLMNQGRRSVAANVSSSEVLKSTKCLH